MLFSALLSVSVIISIYFEMVEIPDMPWDLWKEVET